MVIQTHMVPDVGHPGRERPLDVRVSQVCGVRYHEGTVGVDTPLCSCRTFSIGVCSTCGSPVCGDHSELSSGLRLCLQCLAERTDAEAVERTRAAEERARRQIERAATAAARAPEVLQRFLQEAGSRNWPLSVEIHDQPADLVKAARAAKSRATYGWDIGIQPQGWAARRRERATRPRPTRVVARGWKVGERSLGMSTDDGRAPETESFASVYFLTDGTQATCHVAPGGLIFHTGTAIVLTDAQLAVEVQRIAARAGIPLQ